MSDGFYFIDILIFAMIAAFLVYRLRSVLGRRNGDERHRPNPFAPVRPAKNGSEPVSNNVRVLPTRPVPAMAEPASLASSLMQLQAAEPTFDEKAFLQGARMAFEMIVTAYAQGDTTSLRPLLSNDVFHGFAASIRDRTTIGNTHETRIDRIVNADLTQVRVEGRAAYCTVQFVSIQMNVTRNRNGDVVDGDPEHAIEVTDIWTFARTIGSPNPNWTLVETRTPH